MTVGIIIDDCANTVNLIAACHWYIIKKGPGVGATTSGQKNKYITTSTARTALASIDIIFLLSYRKITIALFVISRVYAIKSLYQYVPPRRLAYKENVQWLPDTQQTGACRLLIALPNLSQKPRSGQFSRFHTAASAIQ